MESPPSTDDVARNRRIGDFYLAGNSTRECSKVFGLCQQRISQILREMGVKLRSGVTNANEFWAYVDMSPGQGPGGDCWEWRRGCLARGYGGLRFKGKRWLAHRLAYFFGTGHFPQLFILHSCDNPLCCNPAHLREGTQQDNVRDMISRGRDRFVGRKRKNSC